MDLLRYRVSASFEEAVSLVLYRDAGVFRIRTDRGRLKGRGTPVTEAEAQALLHRLEELKVPLNPERATPDCDGVGYELSGGDDTGGFSLVWSDNLPTPWVELAEIVTWLQERAAR